MKVRIVAAILALFSFSLLAGFTTKSNLVTTNNLQEAFKGESTASAKYAAYAKKAQEEGYTNIAKLFQAASKSESIHAGNHKAVLEQLGVNVDKVNPKFEVKSTKENLQDAIKGESYEVATMYPDFLKKAGEENATLASISFNYAYQTEQKHKVFYQDALDKLNAGKASEVASTYYVCPTCGNTYENKADKRCGISMTSSEKFIKIN